MVISRETPNADFDRRQLNERSQQQNYQTFRTAFCAEDDATA